MSSNIRGVRRARMEKDNPEIKEGQKKLGKTAFTVIATPEECVALVELASKYYIRNYRDTPLSNYCKYKESDFGEDSSLLWSGSMFIQGRPDKHRNKKTFDEVVRLMLLPKPTEIEVQTTGNGIVTVHKDGDICVGLRIFHITDVERIVEAYDKLQ